MEVRRQVQPGAVVAHEPLDRQVELADQRAVGADRAAHQRDELQHLVAVGRVLGDQPRVRVVALAPGRVGRVVAPAVVLDALAQRVDAEAVGAVRRARSAARRASPRAPPGCASSGRAARAGRRGSTRRRGRSSQAQAEPPKLLTQLVGGVVRRRPRARGTSRAWSRVAEPRVLDRRVVRDVVEDQPEAERGAPPRRARRSPRACRSAGRRRSGRRRRSRSRPSASGRTARARPRRRRAAAGRAAAAGRPRGRRRRRRRRPGTSAGRPGRSPRGRSQSVPVHVPVRTPGARRMTP